MSLATPASTTRRGRRSRRRSGRRLPSRNQSIITPVSAYPIPSRDVLRGDRADLNRHVQTDLANSTNNRDTASRAWPPKMKANVPFQKLSSFFSQSSPHQIMHELTLILKSQPDCDMDVHATGFKIRGRKFLQHQCCDFQIELFSTTSSHEKPNQILVEIRRRDGDGFVFQHFLQHVFRELSKTRIIDSTLYTIQSQSENAQFESESFQSESFHSESEKISKLSTIDARTLQIVITALFSDDGGLCRQSAAFLANRIANNYDLVDNILGLEKHFIPKISDLLLKCSDPQIVRSVGTILYYMLCMNNDLKQEANNLQMKKVCEKVLRRWTEPVQQRYGSKDKYVIRVLPSMQVAQRMNACIQVLE